MAWIWYRTVKGNSVHSHGSWIPKSFAPWQDVRKSWQSIRPAGRQRKCVTCVCVSVYVYLYILYIYIYICACAFLYMCLCGLAMQFEARMQPCAATLACKKCKLLPSVCSMAHHGSPWLSHFPQKLEKSLWPAFCLWNRSLFHLLNPKRLRAWDQAWDGFFRASDLSWKSSKANLHSVALPKSAAFERNKLQRKIRIFEKAWRGASSSKSTWDPFSESVQGYALVASYGSYAICLVAEHRASGLSTLCDEHLR